MRFIVYIILFFGTVKVYAQDCVTELEGFAYEGDCKKGMAHGTGLMSNDTLSYKGEFKKGLPDGEGVIIKGDKRLELEFDKGQIASFGKLFEGEDLLQEGYWKGDIYSYRYVGSDESDLAGYEILQEDNLGQAQTSVSKSDNDIKSVIIRLSDPKNRSISNVSVAERTSGQVTNSTINNSRTYLEINAIDFPYVMTLRYSVSNQSGNFSLPVILRVKIKEPGEWKINITH